MSNRMVHAIAHEEAQISKFSHSRKRMKRFDKMMLFIGLINPIMSIPQALNIWLNKDAGQVSAISWTTYVLVNLFWLFYALIHKSKPLIISTTLWIVIEIIIVIGIAIY